MNKITSSDYIADSILTILFIINGGVLARFVLPEKFFFDSIMLVGATDMSCYLLFYQPDSLAQLLFIGLPRFFGVTMAITRL